MIFPVILSGGSGSRLWPVSREHYPKQFLNLNSETHSLLQETALRINGLENCCRPILVCNEEHRFLVAEQMQNIGITPSSLLLEPVGRNTAPALALAALSALENDSDPTLLVMPADHVIQDNSSFIKAVNFGLELSENNNLVTFGVEPLFPNTGYGYIHKASELGEGFSISSFVEKPNKLKAQEYLDSGEYLWNSGIFLFRAKCYLNELSEYAPDILKTCKETFEQRQKDLDFVRFKESIFSTCRSDSIDYAVMEHTRNAAVIPMNPGWSDIGAWDALYDLKAKPDSDNGNATHGDVLLRECRNSYVRSESRLVAAIGVDNLIIVETDDAVLVTDRASAQQTKEVVNLLKSHQRSEYLNHKHIYRPWGYYRTMVLADGFQVKEIVVNPGQRLSLQMHHHRAEHWVVVRGTARVTLGELEKFESFLLSEDESTYITLGKIHRLENPGRIPLRLIEVQTGSYLGEDDIVRFDDIYGRTPDSSKEEK
ncbi:mannose-1-phosphate guanylyltransferase/mannose-6-phosphate isomerase [Larsenimonas salina]|uniref:mannose-1-phosphate guanylyltransferase/mannose-6-phosphate isomerase n=1 Tax=Larsenimonas salina TaxID=1295565 RepID=UPI00207406CF|nr:mannose-1-phosphate guanylyltransferase/mannose-6-phosphate isomerase [Larsenimonas salina]MCM5704934.1 mannose-1-phosphate guanylyltransferase/mannose-6-phosphate isomerase [Larsenimonas salina]